jgi:hypothetical protein
MEPMTFTAALASGHHAVSLVRAAIDGVKALGKTEVVNQLIDVQLSLMDVLEKCQQLQTENHQVENEKRKLQELLDTVPTVEFHYEACWKPRLDGSLDGPFSPQVWDAERKLMRMNLVERLISTGSCKVSHLRFQCLKFQKYSAIPIGFMAEHKVWSPEELDHSPPRQPKVSMRNSFVQGGGFTH